MTENLVDYVKYIRGKIDDYVYEKLRKIVVYDENKFDDAINIIVSDYNDSKKNEIYNTKNIMFRKIIKECLLFYDNFNAPSRELYNIIGNEFLNKQTHLNDISKINQMITNYIQSLGYMKKTENDDKYKFDGVYDIQDITNFNTNHEFDKIYTLVCIIMANVLSTNDAEKMRVFFDFFYYFINRYPVKTIIRENENTNNNENKSMYEKFVNALFKLISSKNINNEDTSSKTITGSHFVEMYHNLYDQLERTKNSTTTKILTIEKKNINKIYSKIYKDIKTSLYEITHMMFIEDLTHDVLLYHIYVITHNDILYKILYFNTLHNIVKQVEQKIRESLVSEYIIEYNKIFSEIASNVNYIVTSQVELAQQVSKLYLDISKGSIIYSENLKNHFKRKFKGGTYHDKYLKYKNLYLQLKNKKL